MIDPKEVRARLEDVIAAMKKNGAWEIEKPAAAAFEDMGAFGMKTMAFEQWLRFVFVPNVDKAIAADGPWPSTSQVGVHATREGDGNPVVSELVPALAAFDALFESADAEGEGDGEDSGRDDGPPRILNELPPPARHAYERSRAAFAKGDHAAALVAIDEALATDPTYPNARNFAGWILLHMPARTPAHLEGAIAHFREAVRLGVDLPTLAANLCEALLAAGREEEAVAEAERLGAHNWLGWYWMGSPKTLDRAIARLKLAIQTRWDWAVAHSNLAKALELAHRSDEAYEEHGRALESGDDFDRAFCYERRGAYEARKSWPRNALRSFRAALREDTKRGGAREKTYREAIDWLEGEMSKQGIPFAKPDRELTDASWARACELELPAGWGARDERGQPLADDIVEVERRVRAERWQDAVAQLEELKRVDVGKLFDAVGFAERGAELARRAGHREEALAMMRLVVDGYRAYASWATSGGEGLARTADADAKRDKLAAWEREG